MTQAQHYPLHHPHTSDGCGYQVCSCGATRRVERGVPVGEWHTCDLCTYKSWATWADHNEVEK